MEAAKKRISGDTSGYIRIVEDIKADGISQNVVVRAVNSKVNKLNNDEKKEESSKGGKEATVQSLYSGQDIVSNLEKNDTGGAQKVIDNMMKEAKTTEEKKKKQSSIKSAITSYYKPLYQEGSLSTRNEIRGKLSRLRVNGKQLYSGKDYASWKQ